MEDSSQGSADSNESLQGHKLDFNGDSSEKWTLVEIHGENIQTDSKAAVQHTPVSSGVEVNQNVNKADPKVTPKKSSNSRKPAKKYVGELNALIVRENCLSQEAIVSVRIYPSKGVSLSVDGKRVTEIDDFVWFKFSIPPDDYMWTDFEYQYVYQSKIGDPSPHVEELGSKRKFKNDGRKFDGTIIFTKDKLRKIFNKFKSSFSQGLEQQAKDGLMLYMKHHLT